LAAATHHTLKDKMHNVSTCNNLVVSYIEYTQIQRIGVVEMSMDDDNDTYDNYRGLIYNSKKCTMMYIFSHRINLL